MNKYFNLQLFAEGEGSGTASVGDGGAAGGTPGVESQSPADEIKGLPDRVRKKVYGDKPAANTGKAVEEAAPSAAVPTGEKAPVETKKPTYEELINSDEYREEHRQHVKKAVDDRWKKYRGIEKQLESANGALEFVAFKYGIDPSSETFMDDLKAALEADDSFVEDYADKHNMPTDEARRVMQMQRKMEKLQRAEEAARKETAVREYIQKLVKAGEKTKARFPEFDLDVEMANPEFANLVRATNGNTTAAYIACHSGDIIARERQSATDDATNAVMSSVKNNTARPVENGISHSATALSQVNISDMTLSDFKKIQREFKKTGVRPKF